MAPLMLSFAKGRPQPLSPTRIGSLLLFSALWSSLLPGHAWAQVSLSDAGPKRPASDARALHLLQKMTAAYGKLKALDQTTGFHSGYSLLAPKTPLETPSAEAATEANKESELPRKLHLVFATPNRLLLEAQDSYGAGGMLATARTVSDGKFFWTFQPDTNRYTRDKAPAQIREFRQLSHLDNASLELLMLLGVDPFANIREEADIIQYTGTENVRGVDTEVVSISKNEKKSRTELRFYIGREDSLLRRVRVETTPRTQENVSIGDGLDALKEDLNDAPTANTDQAGNEASLPASPGRALLASTYILYDNTIQEAPAPDETLFVFTPPPGATRYTPVGEEVSDARAKRLFDILKRNGRKRIHHPHEISH